MSPTLRLGIIGSRIDGETLLGDTDTKNGLRYNLKYKSVFFSTSKIHGVLEIRFLATFERLVGNFKFKSSKGKDFLLLIFLLFNLWIRSRVKIERKINVLW